ncbi:hypothetical protein [Actinoplanes philippinensis]|uniref:hypothetical protein n=1 Tax=Actinoplanes philippinensis TaxID=35752 RepID=UPI0033F0FB99
MKLFSDRAGRRTAIGGLLLVAVAGVIALAPPATAETASAADDRPVMMPRRQPVNAVDPGVPGTLGTVEGEYDLPAVTLPGLRAPVEMQALVIAPKGGASERPMVVFLHGRQDACYTPEEGFRDGWPCPEGSRAVPSHRGFRSMQQLLASQGYVTVSIAANGVNAQDGLDDGGAQARSSLVRLHLGKWADWAGRHADAAPAIVRQAAPADLSRVMLVGHSRGGEGANRAVMDTVTPPPAAVDGYRGRVRWTIRGLVGIGPTSGGQNPVPDVPSMMLLGGCDGDAALEGQMYVDATRGVSNGRALHSALYVIGANHNFYNTEWTPGQSAAPSDDDWWATDDPLCGPGRPTRLTAAQQQRAGATYVAAAARVFLLDDDAVLPLIDGTGVSAPSADPAHVLSHAIGAARTPVIIPGPALRLGGARLCEQVNHNDEGKECLPYAEGESMGSPHFTGFNYMDVEPGRWAVRLNAGEAAVLTPPRAADVAGELAMRLIVPPNTSGNTFGVAATDRSGRRVDLGDVSVDGVPGTRNTFGYWAREVRVPLKGLSSIAELEIEPRGSATGWLLDAWGHRPGTPDPQGRPLPRIDVGAVRAREGDAGTTTIDLPLTVTGSGTGQVRVFLDNRASAVLTVKPGDRRLTVPFQVPANTRYGDDTRVLVHAKAVRGLVVGNFFATSVIENDDPAPAVEIDAQSEVTEGATLRWGIHLSEPADTPICLDGAVVSASGGPEVSTTDLDPRWLGDQGLDPEPSRPLSTAGVYVFTCVEAGQDTGVLEIPTATDDLAENPEQIRIEAKVELGSTTHSYALAGRVTDGRPAR